MAVSRTTPEGASRLPHLPALDGFRGVTVTAVLFFHAGFAWMKGGFLAITSFFVLSGFLITSLLLRERDLTGRIDLKAFWARRARRLVPAAVLGVLLIAGYLLFAGGHDRPGLVGDAAASLGWVANWRFILAGRSYASAFQDPSPFQHLWSLAVEEQFYLVLPLVATVFLLLWPGRPGGRRRFQAVVVALAGMSILAMRHVHHPHAVLSRDYYGSDTRAAELLVGVLLATLLIGPHGLRAFSGRTARLVGGIGLAGLAATLVLWSNVAEHAEWLYAGGLTAVAAVSAAVVAACTQPRSLIARLLSARPLVALGRISYGVYVYHWPIFLWLGPRSTGLSPWPLMALRAVVVLILAAGSYRWVETPIRSGRLRPRLALVAWADAAVAAMAGIAVAAATLPSLGITLTQAAAVPSPVFPTAVPATTVLPRTAATVVTAPRTSKQGTQAAITSTSVASTVPATPPPTSLAARASRTGEATLPAPTSPAGSTAAPTLPPLRIAVVGDSQAKTLATGLKSWGPTNNVAVLDLSVNGCTADTGGYRREADGLWVQVDDRCGWWHEPSSAPWQALHAFHPDLVLVETGMNDVFDRSLPAWGNQFKSPGDGTFDAYTDATYAAMVTAMHSGFGARVAWTTMPCDNWLLEPTWMSPSEADQRTRYENGTLIPAFTRTSTVTLVDLGRQLCPGGTFIADPMGIPNARPDGFHLSDAAVAQVTARWLGPLLLSDANRH